MLRLGHWCLVIGASFGIRASAFGFPPLDLRRAHACINVVLATRVHLGEKPLPMKPPALSAAAIMDAAARCNLNRIRQLLADGAKPEHLMTKSANAVTEACFGWWGGWEKQEKTRLAVVSELVSAGCRVEGQALYRPIDRGELELVRFLIEHGADPNVIAPKEFYTGVPKGCTPLGVAVQYGRTEMVAELIRAGADVNQRSGAKYGFGLSSSTSPIVKAAACNQPQIIRLLVAAGANPSVCDAGDYYGTPLLNAIAFGHEGAVKELIAAGADTNQAAGHDGWLPLAYAKDKKLPRIVKILESAKAAIPEKYGSKEELGRAAQRGDLKAVKELLAKRADVNARCSFAPGNPAPLTLAAEKGHTKVVEVLLKAGARHDAVDTAAPPPCSMPPVQVTPARSVRFWPPAPRSIFRSERRTKEWSRRWSWPLRAGTWMPSRRCSPAEPMSAIARAPARPHSLPPPPKVTPRSSPC